MEDEYERRNKNYEFTMKVLFVSWELDPFFKFGGLGDVARSLPGALRNLGVDIRIAIPFYDKVKLGHLKPEKKAVFIMEYGGKKERVEAYEVTHPLTKVQVYLLKNAKHLSEDKRGLTFSFFDKAVVELCRKNYLDFTPDIIHCNDHHTGLIPLLVKESKLPIKSILTIHNLAHQGIIPIDIVMNLGLPRSKFLSLAWDREADSINFMMEAIMHADIVNTVSPTYAREIKTREFGAGMDEILRGKEGRLFGILNGIDREEEILEHYKKAAYPYLKPAKITGKHKIYAWEEGKRLNKLALQKKAGLPVTDKAPLMSFVGRLAEGQKGLDILYKMLKNIDGTKYQMAVLGTGDKKWEDKFRWLCRFYPKNMYCDLNFDPAMAVEIYAASDFILIPSKFEPCGLIQMIGMLCGTLPVAHKTGGLADSIIDGKNGFLFESYSEASLKNAVDKALEVWHHKRKVYKKMVEAAMATDLSWQKSAQEYKSLYDKLAEGVFS